jgi:diguanylate cyclase (GGDEF)-like protein/PAS domain S-box-containing protein
MTISISSCLQLESNNLIAVMEASIRDLAQIVIITNNPNIDKSGLKILYVNEALSRVSGYSSDEVIGQNPSILQGPDTSPEILVKIREAIKKEKYFSCELLNYSKSGKEYWIDLNLTPLSIDGKSCDFFIGHSFDITHHKQSRKIATEKEENLEFVLASAGLGYWDIDLINNQTNRSSKHGNLYGYAAMLDEWSYETFLSHIIEEDKSSVDAAFKKVMSVGGDYDVEFRCRWPDGSIHWLWSKGRFITNEHNQVVRAAGIQADIAEKKSAQQEIYNLAYTDELTKLPNRSAFKKKLENLLLKKTESAAYHALFFLDLDDFKVINDTLGHDMGDALLISIAKRFKTSLSNVNIISRFGGDEFVMLAESISSNAKIAYQKAEAVAGLINEIFKEPFYCKNQEFHTHVSVGVTLFNGAANNKYELLKQADLALYHAKFCGKNTYSFFDESLHLDLTRRTNLEKDLRNALVRDELFLIYQPKVDPNNHIVGAEALIRWLHPTQGIISPAEFIPLAEDTGLIVPIGEWILKEAIKFIKTWPKFEVSEEFKLSINISPIQFNHERFVERFSFLLNELRHQADMLVLEITETTVIENLDDSIVKMNILKEYGVTFSLDDFGSGFSSLNYLKLLPINEIKIDKSFIDDIVDDRRNVVILNAIINIAKDLDLNLVIEGVESIEQVSLLNTLGAKVYQGFYFSEPLSENDLIKFIATHRQ